MLEGLTNDSYWDWKNSLGPLRNRPGFQGVWGYQQTNGLGLMEYLEWSEDMGLERSESISNLTSMLLHANIFQFLLYGLVSL
jgi:alpha-L-arabinofuranosidase